jgi:predicted nucleic acid-binding protein
MALGLIADINGLGGRDAVHAATAIRHGLSTTISPDRAFDLIPGPRRIEPAAAV